MKTTGGRKTKDIDVSWQFHALLLYGDDLVGPLGESVRAAFGEQAVTRYVTAQRNLDDTTLNLKMIEDTIPKRAIETENAMKEVVRLRREVESLTASLNAAESELAKHEKELRTQREKFQRLQGEVKGGRLDFLRRNFQPLRDGNETGGKRSRTDGRGTDDESSGAKKKKRKAESKKADAKTGSSGKHKKPTPPGSRSGSVAASPARTTTPSRGNVSMHIGFSSIILHHL